MQVLLAHLLDTFNTQLFTTLPSRHRQQQQQLQQAYGITSGLPKGQMLPTSGQKQDWLTYAAALPNVDQPGVLGLPANIGRSIALGNSKRLLAALRQLNVAQVRQYSTAACLIVLHMKGEGARSQ
jgi:hypothetical protein